MKGAPLAAFVEQAPDVIARLLATVGQTFSAQGINISEALCRAGDDGRAVNVFTFMCSDLDQLKGVMRD